MNGSIQPNLAYLANTLELQMGTQAVQSIVYKISRRGFRIRSGYSISMQDHVIRSSKPSVSEEVYGKNRPNVLLHLDDSAIASRNDALGSTIQRHLGA